MSTFALQLASTGKVAFANNTTLAGTSTPWIRFHVLGSTLNALTSLTGAQQRFLVGMTNAAESAIKMALAYTAGAGTPYFKLVDSAGNEWLMTNVSGSLAPGTFNPGDYYECVVACDNATMGVPAVFKVYAPGDFFGTTLFQAYSTSAVTIDTASSRGCVIIGNSSWAGFSHTAGTQEYDLVKAGHDSSIADFDAELDEGTGTSVSPSGTISGSYTWVSLALADHGVVTITPNTALNGSGTTPVATVDWKDSSNVSLVPQPATTWSVLTDSAAVTINASGNITLVAPGTATIRATTGAVHADADITVRPDRVFSLTATIV